MENAVTFRTIMNGSDRDHPNEDALERFLLHQCGEDELEIVETHIFACEACVDKLETLEFQMAAIKMAARNIEQSEQAARATQLHAASSNRFRFGWLTIPRLSIAGASLAACAAAITLMFVPRDVQLTTYRGIEANLVSQWLPLDLHLNARDIPAGNVSVQIVNSQGEKIWQGTALAKNDQIDVKVSRLTATGHYFVRVYPAHDDSDSALLREFSIQTKP